ncbi:putative small protein [Methanocella conradii HZ254]|uniref:Small protein n=1 Tax=Methanocella conradii (strain DSM 24694 / JCM 17849 / CGMCC 1.5162 / HZ254) TaxID=1041930 RepID=H8I6S5_METCZ|nr:UPF0175 family protein [Methanocella conradii]AFC99395.1 putative small protein [Methanocella conradii HZ254]
MEADKYKEKVLKNIKNDIVEKYILLLLASSNCELIDGKTKLMKELFFISKNVPKLEEKADFQADNFGPSSDIVIERLEQLKSMGLIDDRNNKYILTSVGKEFLTELYKNTSMNDLKVIDHMKGLFNQLSEDEILGIVYTDYPEMTRASLVKNKIKNKKLSIAINLLKKGKVSIGKAAKIADMPIDVFYDKLKELGVKVEMGY